MKVFEAVHGTRTSSFPDNTRMFLRFSDAGISFVCRNMVPGSSRSRTRRNEGGKCGGSTGSPDCFSLYSINSM